MCFFSRRNGYAGSTNRLQKLKLRASRLRGASRLQQPPLKKKEKKKKKERTKERKKKREKKIKIKNQNYCSALA